MTRIHVSISDITKKYSMINETLKYNTGNIIHDVASQLKITGGLFGQCIIQLVLIIYHMIKNQLHA